MPRSFEAFARPNRRPGGVPMTAATCEHEFPHLDDEGTKRGPCASCGTAYAEHDLTDLAETIAPVIAAEHGRWPALSTIAVETEDYLAQHGIALDIGDFELLFDEVHDLIPTAALVAA